MLVSQDGIIESHLRLLTSSLKLRLGAPQLLPQASALFNLPTTGISI